MCLGLLGDELSSFLDGFLLVLSGEFGLFLLLLGGEMSLSAVGDLLLGLRGGDISALFALFILVGPKGEFWLDL